jgi:hypothetical protein
MEVDYDLHLRSGETSVDIDRFMDFTLPGLLATASERTEGRKERGGDRRISTILFQLKRL